MDANSNSPGSPLKGIVSVVVGLVLAALGYTQFAPGHSPGPAVENPPLRTEPERPTEPRHVERPAPPAPAPSRHVEPPAPAAASGPRRNLEEDERKHGHTLSKHVGRSDAELIKRLHDEPDIASASTWTDRATAERCVGEAIDANQSKINAWLQRGGDDKLAFDHSFHGGQPIGRSVRHGKTASEPCFKARVVLALDRRSKDYFVLTSYPEAR